MLLLLHDVIDEVGDEKISVDEGFSKVVRLVFGFNNYLSLNYQAKFKWLCDIAEITYAAVQLTPFADEEIEYYYDLLMDKCYSDGIDF